MGTLTGSSVLHVRELTLTDIPYIVNYWSASDPAYLTGLGVDLAKIPGAAALTQMLTIQLAQPYNEKHSYALIWEIDGEPCGHSNINKIIFGKEAFMHLHIWNKSQRQQGAGTALVKKSLPFYFNNFQLENLYCEPYALNPAPHKTLVKAGFRLTDEYTCTPGVINFEQPVKLWMINRSGLAVQDLAHL